MPSEQERDRLARGQLVVHGPDRVEALFVEEVAAQEAIGLLSFHGFRRGGVGLRPAAGTRWRRVRPLRHRRFPERRGPAMAGAGTGLVAVAVGLGVAGRWPAAVPELLLLAAAALVGALIGALPDPPVSIELSTDVLTPNLGCIVAVLTLRAEEARTVLERAGGILVLPEHSATDADGHGWDGHGPDPAGRG